MEGGPIISHRDEFLYPNKAAMTGLVFFAPWASARGVLLLRIFERKGVFWTILSETIRIAKRGASCPHCGQLCRPLQFATAPLRSCPNFGQLPMMSLSQFATSEPKGVFQVATNCRNLAPCRASEFRTSTTVPQQLRN